MIHQRIKYLSIFLILFVSSAFRGLLLLVSYFSVVSVNEKLAPQNQIPISKVINAVQIMPAMLLMAEAILYVAFRKRFFLRRLVRWHLWMTVVSSVILPIIEIVLLAFIFPSVYSSKELAEITTQYEGPTLFFGWFLFGIARLFFIAAMVKSVTSFNDQKQPNEPSGFLDDFAQ